MKTHRVDQDTEVILDGKRYLLEQGDRIVMEERIEGYREVANHLAKTLNAIVIHGKKAGMERIIQSASEALVLAKQSIRTAGSTGKEQARQELMDNEEEAV